MRNVYSISVFLTLTIGIGSAAFGQVNFGFKTGMNISNLKFDYTETKAVAQFNAGIVSEITLSDKFFIRPELLYSEKGWKVTDISTKLKYINLPVLGGYRLFPNCAILLGPEVGYLLGARRKPAAPDFTLPYEKFDYGVALGGSYVIVKRLPCN